MSDRSRSELIGMGYQYWDTIERDKKEVAEVIEQWSASARVGSANAVGSLRVAFARGFVQGFKAHEQETSIQEQYEHAERMVVEWAARAEVLKKEASK